MSTPAPESLQWLTDQRIARCNAEATRQSRFNALKILLPDRLTVMHRLTADLDLARFEVEALEREIENATWAKASQGGKTTPTGHALAAARNELRPVITEKFRALGVAGYVAEKQNPQTL